MEKNLQMDAIEHAFRTVDKNLTTGKFNKNQLTFIRDLSQAMANGAQKVLDRIPAEGA